MLDFSLVKSEKIENIGKISLFVHKSGGRAVCIDNDDENRVFSLCFDTPAYDDTGAAHVLEHCVLCGSEKFPAKDPFNLLDTNVPHTYLNAITFPHKTLFPVASLDEKALLLMAKVYCDGVFDPLVYKNKGIFVQEKKVVYGEMSGFYDDPENLAERYLKSAFTPHFSAGLPESIPNLRYQDLLDYHKKHYTGANCLAYIYGKGDKEPYLELLNEYFRGGEKISQTAVLKKEVKYIPVPTDVNAVLYPLCKTSDHVSTHIYGLVADALKKRLDGLKISFDDTGDIAYIKITGEIIDGEIIKKAVQNTKIDPESLRFYIENGDFGYKPRGLYYGLRLMYSDGNFVSLDFKNIFKKINEADAEKYTAAFENNGIFARKGGETPKAQAYVTEDKEALDKYRNTKEKSGIIPLIIPEKAPEEPLSERRGDILYTPAKGDIIYLTLAFGLDIQKDLLVHAGALVRNYKTDMPHFSVEICDVCAPCLVMNMGFFADKADLAANDINRIFTASDGICTLDFYSAPEKLTDLIALGGIEKNAYILKTAVENKYKNTDIPQALREVLYTQKNMSAAVCCSEENFGTAEKIIGNFELFNGISSEKTAFRPDHSQNITEKDVNVNTISLAFTHSGEPTAAFAAAEIIKTALLWEKVRGAGAYGSTAYVTPSGSFCMNSFKDINFEKTIDTFFECIGLMQNFAPDDDEMKRYKLMCLNITDRPKTRKRLNYKALKRSFGSGEEVREKISDLTAEDIRRVFAGFDKAKAKIAAVKGMT